MRDDLVLGVVRERKVLILICDDIGRGASIGRELAHILLLFLFTRLRPLGQVRLVCHHS